MTNPEKLGDTTDFKQWLQNTLAVLDRMEEEGDDNVELDQENS